jgi:hypothetical protein
MSEQHDIAAAERDGWFLAAATVGAGGEIVLPAEAAGLRAGDEILFVPNAPGVLPRALMALERETLHAFLSGMATRMAALAVEREAAPPDEKNQRRVG